MITCATLPLSGFFHQPDTSHPAFARAASRPDVADAPDITSERPHASLRSPASPPIPVLAAALRRCARAGFSVVVTGPADATKSFVENAGAAVQGDTWCVKVLDAQEVVVGMVALRLFRSPITPEDWTSLLLVTGQPARFRAECIRAVADVIARGRRYARTPAEMSRWFVASGRHARLVAATLCRSVMALMAAFEQPLTIVAVNPDRCELPRFMRWACTPLIRSTSERLPPFTHRPTGTRLRLVLFDPSVLGIRLRSAEVDLEVLRERCPSLGGC